MASSNNGSKRTTKKGPSSSRGTKPTRHVGSNTGRYLSAHERGRYTPPVPKSTHHSPAWFGPTIIALFLLGLLLLILNYVGVMPGGTSAWYIVAGVFVIFLGFAATLRYH